MNEATDLLEAAITTACGLSLALEWKSPLAQESYVEYRDEAFLKALHLERFIADLRQFWPASGPRWDALATDRSSGGSVFLIEAKSHVPELYGSGCQASDPRSLRLIQQAFARTQQWLHLEDPVDWLTGEHSTRKSDQSLVNQTRRLYQYSNRLAHLFLLRRVFAVDAWLVNLYITADPRTPTTRHEWSLALREVKTALGFQEVPWAVDVFLPALG